MDASLLKRGDRKEKPIISSSFLKHTLHISCRSLLEIPQSWYFVFLSDGMLPIMNLVLKFSGESFGREPMRK
ncbi:MAG: hypothetical protein DRP00_03645 [Candidatus Aenigmatarchaeota archaeon]|nr:MAG: hypothetical protein DRP00_03645 [Candidatus Aenigmarchaeota archaeon]